MRLAKMMMAVAACSLATTPVLAAPAASKLSVSSASRAATPAGDSNAQSGGFPFLIVFVVVAAGLGLYFAVDGGTDGPVSP